MIDALNLLSYIFLFSHLRKAASKDQVSGILSTKLTAIAEYFFLKLRFKISCVLGVEVAMTERDFEPAGGQDIDDEATIEEEETLEAGEGFNHDELDDLQKVHFEVSLFFTFRDYV